MRSTFYIVCRRGRLMQCAQTCPRPACDLRCAPVWCGVADHRCRPLLPESADRDHNARQIQVGSSDSGRSRNCGEAITSNYKLLQGHANSMRDFAGHFRPFFIHAAVFSLIINLLMLVPALFMLQVYDRVVTSRSHETLLMLALLTGGALGFMAYLDVIRSRLLSGCAVALEKLLGPRVLADMIARGSNASARDAQHGLRDIGTLRAFLTGPGIVALFDAPWVPLYVVIIFLFHPLLGMIALGGSLILLALAYGNERQSRKRLEQMQVESRKAGRFADQSVTNAELAGALGMTENLSRGWQAISTGGLRLQLEVSRRASLFTSATNKFMRQFLQVAMLAAGAWLVIEQQATSGIMIAATILLGRALAPVETAIASWKGL